MTPRTVAHQAPLSMGFSRQEYWNGLPCPPPGDLPSPRMEPKPLKSNLHWQAGSLPLEPTGKPENMHAAAAKSLQLCPTLCCPMDCSLLGSSAHGILQARILEWVAISYSRGSPHPRDQTHFSCISRWILDHRATWEAHT